MPIKYAKPSSESSAYQETPALKKTDFFKIRITHLPTEEDITFDGWVTHFSDQFSSNWNTETVYGRMDPLATFQGTQRTISLGFDIVSGDIAEASLNLAKVSRLIEFLYPVYNSALNTNQNTLKAAPVIGLRWTNLISSARNGEKLVGFLDGVTYAPDITAGGFLAGSKSIESVTWTAGPYEITDLGTGKGENFERTVMTEDILTSKGYIPKQLSLNLNYTVIHTHLMGWAMAGGGYKFGGDDDINGKFPNNQRIKYKSQDIITILEDSEGNLVTRRGENGVLVDANESDILSNSQILEK